MNINRFYKGLKRRLLIPFHTMGALWQIKKMSRNDNESFVLFSGLFGDFVIGMAYMSDLCKKLKGEGRSVTLCLPQKRKDLVELYAQNFNVRYYPSKAKDLKRMQWILQSRRCIHMAKKHGIYCTVPWFAVNAKTEQRDALTIVREDLYQLEGDVKIEFPKVPQVDIVSIDDFYANKDRIVIVNPYSTSMYTVDFAIFELITQELIKAGYLVYTNVVGEQKPVKGTLPLRCSIYEMYNICNYIPFVVSVRSGIIDFCVSATTKFFVLYFNIEVFYKIWTLNTWKMNNATEVFHRQVDDTLGKFREFLNSMQDK